MKTLKEIINECQISYSELILEHKEIFEGIVEKEKDWLNNIEEKTYRFPMDVKPDIEYVILKIKSKEKFTTEDTPKLSVFTSKINSILRIANRINNFKEGTILDNSKQLSLFELFNAIVKSNHYNDLNYDLNKNLNSFLPHLYSIIKHCQQPSSYPLYYRYWKNILGEVLNEKDDYDSLCKFYKNISEPKHLNLGAYFGTIGINLAKKITENNIIKSEGDKNYNYIKNNILNIHYFDYITGYLRKPNYFLIGSKYGENNIVDVFPEMLNKNVVSVGFAQNLDLSHLYLNDENEIIEFLKDENETTSSISALKKFLKIKIGDKIAVKSSGSPKGSKGFLSIVGICEVIKDENGEVYHYDPNGLIHSISVKYLHAPIYKEYDLGGYGSTVHHLSKDEHIQMIFNNEDIEMNRFEKSQNKFNLGDFDNYINYLRIITKLLNININDKRVVYSVREDRLNFTIGQRYCFNLFLSNPKGIYGIISNTMLSENSELFNSNYQKPYYTQSNYFIPNEIELNSIIEAMKEELSRTSLSGYSKFNDSDFEKYVFSNDSYYQNIQMNIPQNIILYGPPGTGKTYKLKNDYFSNYTLTENSISPEANFEDVVSALTWWHVIALALLEIGISKVTDILENRWVIKKAQLSESKNVRATVWGTLQMHTIQESENVAYSQRQTPLLFNKTVDKKWELLESEVKEQAPEIYDILDSVNNFKPNPNKEIKHYVFTTFHQSFSYEDFIEGIKPVMEDGQENVTYKIENGIFKELCLRAQNDPTNKYAIFIDEINRGNVSQIFGELITLIEHDKRIGASNEIKVKLPYSKKEFGVPMNVDIIGTMNTADRSVEALDTALRRRFSFKEMMPNEKVITEKNFKDYDRTSIMNLINQRIEVLLDRNYTLGHSYFIKEDFKNSFQNEIIPLLQEYFYNDYGKIGLVLGKGFVREKAIAAKNDKSIFADFDTKNEVDIVKSYELIPFSEINFEEAILTLLV
jgi:Cdc6-like AAA superfamily ATPase